jgi:hypothetical protein
MIGTQTLAQQAHPTKAPGAPLASHPAFTPALMLWFAALFSLSTLAIRGALLESWVMAARIDLLVPAATPPLGAPSRLMLAVVFAVVGGVIGWLAARLLRPAPVESDDGEFQLRQRDRHPDAPARRPISAHAELGDEGLGRASAAYDAPRDEIPAFRPPVGDPFYAASPLGGFAAQPQETSPYHVAPFATPTSTEQADTVFAPVFSAAPHAEPVVAAYAAPPSPAREAEHDDDAFDMPTIDFMIHDAPHGLYVAASTVKEEAGFAPYPSPAAPEEPAHIEDVWSTLPPVVSETDLNPVYTAPVTPIMTPLRAVASQPQVTVQPATKPAPHLAAVSPVPVPPKVAAPVEAPALIGATPVQPRANAGERIAHAPLGDLSHVELIERLAMAIHTREKSATPTAVNDAQGDAPQDDEDDMGATQASLRSALAGLREVK